MTAWPKKEGVVFAGKKALLLDMNGTFMFGEDRFSDSEDFSAHYSKIGGALPREKINSIVRAVYAYLDARYDDEHFRHSFPALETAIHAVAGETLDENDINKIADTFAFHELGHIPREYAAALHTLRQRFTLAAIIDIWSPKAAWLEAFERAGVAGLFAAASFSSDHGMVKPSPKPFERLLGQLGITPSEAVVVGDSPERDLAGATCAGIDCVLVGGAGHPSALGRFGNLLELCDAV